MYRELSERCRESEHAFDTARHRLDYMMRILQRAAVHDLSHMAVGDQAHYVDVAYLSTLPAFRDVALEFYASLSRAPELQHSLMRMMTVARSAAEFVYGTPASEAYCQAWIAGRLECDNDD